MSEETRQAMNVACAALLGVLDDTRPHAAADNADIVAAIDDLIAAHVVDLLDRMPSFARPQVTLADTVARIHGEEPET